MANNISRAAFSLVLTVDGKDYDCSEVSLNFALNRIPSGSAVMVSGRNVDTLKAALIHSTADQFISFIPATITLHPKGQWSPADASSWKFWSNGLWTSAGPQIIFDGYACGLGFRRQINSAVPVISLVHWLADLDFTSSLSSQSHPANPAKFRWWAGSSPTGDQATAQTEFINTTVGRDVFTPGNIQSDLWGSVFQVVFARLASQDVLANFGVDQCTTISKPNDAALAALKRIECVTGSENNHPHWWQSGTDPFKGASSPYHKPLSLGLSTAASLIATGIYDHVANKVLSQHYFNSTVWGKIVGELGPAYGFSVVPRVETAIIAPFVPGLRTTFSDEYGNGKVLDMQDFTNQEYSTTAVRPIRGVGVIPNNLQGDTGLNYQVPVNMLGGCFAPDPDAVGMMIYRGAPAWLDGISSQVHAPHLTIKGGPGFFFSSTTPRLESGSNFFFTGSDIDEPNKALNELGDYYAAQAHWIYATEMLRGRYAVLQGKLRFDLAPGTTVKIKNAGQLFIQDDQLVGDAVASISRVSIFLSAEAPAATTSFQLDYVRTAEENENERTSVGRHPLYDMYFTGAPLVEEYLFPE